MLKKILLGSLMLLFISCANKDLSQAITECNYPDSPETKAPLWVCGAQVEGITASSVGVTSKSKAGVNFMLQQASANARVVLAQRINSDINSSVKSYMKVSSNGELDQEKVDMLNSVSSDVVTRQKLVGTKIIKQIVSPKGALYVLIGFDDKKLYENLLNKALNESYQKENDTWNKVTGDKDFEDVKQSVFKNLAS